MRESYADAFYVLAEAGILDSSRRICLYDKIQKGSCAHVSPNESGDRVQVLHEKLDGLEEVYRRLFERTLTCAQSCLRVRTIF